MRQIVWRHRACAFAACCLFALLVRAATGEQAKRNIRYGDVSAGLRAWLKEQGLTADGFDARVGAMERAAIRRETQGEWEHLIFFALQSERFTRRPKIEPALSAYEFVGSLNKGERVRYLAPDGDELPDVEKIPAVVRARLRDFGQALKPDTSDERLRYFYGLLQASGAQRTWERKLQAEYARAMRFLYRKEFGGRTLTGEQLAAYVAKLYQERSHSTDTQIEANFAVATALAALPGSEQQGRINRVLIVGPGLDFAPRTDLIDLFEPQSYQPFAMADALLGLKLAEREQLRIDCIDINDRVIAHLQGLLSKPQVTLSLLSGIGDNARHPLSDDYKSYFAALGRSIGAESTLAVPARFADRLKKSLRVKLDVVQAIRAEKLNIVTERFEPSGYDLVVVTNVFPYFNQVELLLALSNISAMLRPGGFLIHNELQTIPAFFLPPLGLPLKQARTVALAVGGAQPLFDGIAIHQKAVH